MLKKTTVLSLILLTVAVHAESQRREPSLFLEYERELKKTNDSLKDDSSFSQYSPSLSAQKSSSSDSTVKTVAMAETTVLKNTKVDPDTIGKESNPFLVVPKPAPAASTVVCPENISSSELPKNGTHAIVKNLKNAKEKLLARAKDLLGTPYGFGDKDGYRTDCSGFTQQVFRKFGIDLPHSAVEQAQLGQNVSPDDLQIGDLLFYRTYKSDPSHVAIYAGNGQIIHASFTAHKVQYDSMDKEYYKERFMYARRLAFNDSDHDE